MGIRSDEQRSLAGFGPATKRGLAGLGPATKRGLAGPSPATTFPLLTDHATNSAYGESYRTLYANIFLHWQSNPKGMIHHAPTESARCHTLLLATPAASAGCDEADAMVAANLAIVAAQSGNPTILVDADVRTPYLQQCFGLGKSAGLCELLTEESVTPQKVASYLQMTFVPGLRLLCAGTATTQTAGFLFSRKLGEVFSSICQLLLEATATKTSIVIFHSPPVLGSADASLIGALVEETFLTIAAGRTTRTQAKQAQEQLQRTQIKLTGIIMAQA